jgi:two-component system response regulator YesN
MGGVGDIAVEASFSRRKQPVIDDPRLADLIDRDTLRLLLADGEHLSGYHVSVLDAEGNGLPDDGASGSLPHFCRLIQETPQGATRCRQCTLRAAFQAARQQRPHLYRCHAGLTNLAVTLTIGDAFLGTLIVGAALDGPIDAAALIEIRILADQLGLPVSDLAEAARTVPVHAEDRLSSGARLLAGSLTATAAARLHDRIWQTVRLRLDALIRELCAPRPGATVMALPTPERGVVDAWASGDVRRLRAALRQVAASIAPSWPQHPALARLRLLDLLIALARHGAPAGASGEVRDALIPFATSVVGAHSWPELESLLGDLGRELGRLLVLPAPVGDGRIDRVVRYVQVHYQDHLALPEIAQSVGLGPQYFCSLFKAQMGCSFVQYVRRLRLAHARELLRTTELDVTQVAFESGFHDVTYFGQVFKTAEGVTPSQYRRQGGWSHYLPPAPPARPPTAPAAASAVGEGP